MRQVYIKHKINMLEWKEKEIESLKKKSQFQWTILDKVKRRIVYMKTFLYMVECNKILSFKDVKTIIRKDIIRELRLSIKEHSLKLKRLQNLTDSDIKGIQATEYPHRIDGKYMVDYREILDTEKECLEQHIDFLKSKLRKQCDMLDIYKKADKKVDKKVDWTQGYCYL